jgi:hypothetical protein
MGDMMARDSRNENRFLFLMLAAVAVVGLFTSGIMGNVFGSDDATGLAVYEDAEDDVVYEEDDFEEDEGDFEGEYEEDFEDLTGDVVYDDEEYEDDEGFEDEYEEDELYEEDME